MKEYHPPPWDKSLSSKNYNPIPTSSSILVSNYRLLDVIYLPTEKKLHLVFEYAEQDLKKYLSLNKNTITQQQIRLIMFQLINGINFCHSRRIIHRDLKPQNLLIDRYGTYGGI